MARANCPLCGGTGWKLVTTSTPAPADRAAESSSGPALATAAESARQPQAAVRFAAPCDCTATDQQARALERSRIPRRYEHCDFENFEADLPYEEPEAAAWNRSLAQARLLVEAFARDYPVSADHGLLLMGPSGAGKTHLAVAALKAIVLRGHRGLFYDYRDLLKQIQASYNPESQTTEMEVLEPVLNAELLLLDDLGASKPSAWALETVGHILNVRYNEKRTTLATTNYLDAPPRGEDSLADRVGQRIRSRLYEMCLTIELVAPDYRKRVRRASHLGD